MGKERREREGMEGRKKGRKGEERLNQEVEKGK